MNPILVLFDIDGTLVGGSKAGEDAYLSAIQHCYGCRVNLSGYSSAGKTDLLVMRELLERHSFKIDAIDMECLTNAYLEALPEMIIRDPGTVLPGVRALLDILSQRDDFILGLATGNLEEAAKNLFSSLRALDKMPIQVILGELVPDIGLGKAINDRLKRASA